MLLKLLEDGHPLSSIRTIDHGKGFFIEKIRSSLSYKERKALVKLDNNISIGKQCKLLSISRSSFYYEPKKPSKEDILIMKAIDKQYLKTPFYGRRRMKEVLNRQGFKVGQKKVSSLMKKMNLRAVYPKKKTSIPNKPLKIYPYLLKDISITRANQVWCSV